MLTGWAMRHLALLKSRKAIMQGWVEAGAGRGEAGGCGRLSSQIGRWGELLAVVEAAEHYIRHEGLYQMGPQLTLRSGLEVMAAESDSIDLDVNDWSTVLLALCGTRAKAAPIRKHHLGTATKIANILADALGIAPPSLQK